MMRGSLLAIGWLSMLASPAVAGDKVLLAPPESWIKPGSLPPSSKPDDTPVKLLLSDLQIAFDHDRQSVYAHVAYRIQNPTGLAAGNLSFPWRPDTDDFAVHKLLIHRGDQVIDVLASGQTFTVVRREQNLESATLDGVLTANIQPEGLQVGDIIEFATTLTSRDPVMKGHIEEVAAAWNGVPFEHGRLRVQWPSDMKIRYRSVGGLPAAKIGKGGGLTSFELAQDNIEPILAPKGAPPRFYTGRMVEFTDFASWADLGALLAPLFAKASVLPTTGPLRTEFEKIQALSTDPKIRAEAALALVQDRVRYVALAMGTGGLVPADAETTWSRRYGDCKAKTAMLLGLLAGLGIEAEPVAVNAGSGDGFDTRLPMIALFNHVIVRARIGGKIYWLDGTRTGDTSLDRLRVPHYGWGLPLLPQGAALVRMVPEPLTEPGEDRMTRIDATAGIYVPAPIKSETVLRGDAAISTNQSISALYGAAKDNALKAYWRNLFNFVEIKSTATAFDPKTGELRLTMDGVATMDWSSGRYETDGTHIGYQADFERDAGVDHAAPYAVSYPYYTRTIETILLPKGFAQAKTSTRNDISQTVAGIAYERQTRLENLVLTVEKTERSMAPEFAASDAPAAQTWLRDHADKAIYVSIPSSYVKTAQETQQVLASKPSDVDGFMARGAIFAQNRQYEEAIGDFTSAAALDPKNPEPLIKLGMTQYGAGKLDAASKTITAVLSINPRNSRALGIFGLIALQKGQPQEALTRFSDAIAIEPRDVMSLYGRARARHAIDDDDGALADSAAAIKISKALTDAYLFRANIFRVRGDIPAVLKEAETLLEANPGNGYAQVVAAKLFSSSGDNLRAMASYDRALAIKPEAYIYVNRSEQLPKSDIKGRLADLDAALRLEPNSDVVLDAKAALLLDQGQTAESIATLNLALASRPASARLLTNRGFAYLKLNDTIRAERDFSAARKNVSDPVELNNMCWRKATAGAALDSALADCDAALAKMPEAAEFLDSRGLVLLRLDRIDEAIAVYDLALAKLPRMSSSLYGRGIAWTRKGDKSKAATDKAAALKIDPDARSDYEGYGVDTGDPKAH